jgi:threonine/homoserine/homoserine lactone efflux protein
MRSVESASPGDALRLGLLLSAANPKILLLTGAAGLAIGTEADSPAAVAAAVAAFTLVAASTVAVPVVLYAILGERILPPLATAKDWLQANNAAVMAVVVTVIGLVLATKGIQGVR